MKVGSTLERAGLSNQVRPFFIRGVIFFGILLVLGCSIFATRPVQEMSYTLAAIKAAKEVQADTFAPELFRQSKEWFFKAEHEYKFKNFKLAKEYTDKARHLAEQAEFEAIRAGASRSEQAEAGAPPSPVEKTAPLPTPTGTPATDYEKRQAEDEVRKRADRAEELERERINKPPAQVIIQNGPVLPDASTPSPTPTRR